MFAEQVDADMAGRPGVHPVLASPPKWAPTRLIRDQLFAIRSHRQINDPANKCDALLSNGFATYTKSDVNAVHFVHSAWRRNSWHPWRLKRDARSFYDWTYGTLNARLEKGRVPPVAARGGGVGKGAAGVDPDRRAGRPGAHHPERSGRGRVLPPARRNGSASGCPRMCGSLCSLGT